MAGRIPESDIAAIKQRVNIFDVVSDYVTLKRAGAGSFKGLCPFHDEKTPSFTVNVNQGYFKCFGCNESGDTIAFLQKHEHLSFTESVERLAERVGYQISYEDRQGAPKGPSKTRLYEAHKIATEFYARQLATENGQVAVEFLAKRGFDSGALKKFEIGYAPDSWDGLTGLLRQRGFSQEELTASGLASAGSRGIYDRFRGRIMWPIKNITGQTIGFGARKLLESDQGPKYLNSPETPIYQKSQVLYGLDSAKKTIAERRSAIVVEGYTDVMACHLAGITNAVATCGTAFGSDHIRLLRRILGDEAAAEVIFTFDPDSAGEAAALKAFGQDHQFNAHTYIATNRYGLDPSDLRQQQGDNAVIAMFSEKKPLFEFALQHAVKNYDLNTIEGRYGALRRALPVIAAIKDSSLQPEYMRELGKMVGLDFPDVQREFRALKQRGNLALPKAHTAPRELAADTAEANGQNTVAATTPQQVPQITLGMLPQDTGTEIEVDALAAMLQYPLLVGADRLAHAATARVDLGPLKQVRDAIAVSLESLGDGAGWVDRVSAAAPAEVRSLVREIALLPLPNLETRQFQKFVVQSVVRLQQRDFETLQQELTRRLRLVADPGSDEATEIRKHIYTVTKLRREFDQLFE
ncbi:DNA primase [Canibacter zhoujuaniae]|uniref:DNA primase n=1 Tax=Canibacter zhoujuaniae TaxID=2708343 RepID=UPI001421FBA7|nr:DNA primase [Canibacter zhoujuaniae]